MDRGRRRHRAAGVHVLAQVVRADGAVAPQAEHLGFPTSVNGWHGLTTLRWFMLVTIALSLALVYFQATRRSPAVPVSLSVIVLVVALITLIALIYRVLINEPGPDSLIDQKAGAFIGLIATLAIVWGGYLSLREEGVREADGPGDIDTIPLTSVTRPSPASARLESERMLDREQVLHVARLARLELTEDGGRADGERAVARARPHREDPRARPRGRAAHLARHRCRQCVARWTNPEPSLPAEVALASAPEPLEGGFGVPSPGAQA